MTTSLNDEVKLIERNRKYPTLNLFKLRFIYCRSLCNIEYTLCACFWMQICWSYLHVLIIATNRWSCGMKRTDNYQSKLVVKFSFPIWIIFPLYANKILPNIVTCMYSPWGWTTKNLRISLCAKQIHLCCYSQKKTFL